MDIFRDPTAEEVQEIEERTKEQKDYIKELIDKQLKGMEYNVTINPSVVSVVINSNDKTLKERIESHFETEDFTEKKDNMALWSGEVKEKVKKKYKEDITVYYYYNVGDYLYINSHDGFITVTYLDY